MSYIKKLVGEHVYLSPKDNSREAIEKFTRWMNNYDIGDYSQRAGQLTTSLAEKSCADYVALRYDNKEFNIISLDENQLVGTISLTDFDHNARSCALNICIVDNDYRNNGYGIEAINLLLEYGFRYLNLHSIRLELLAINERAHKIYLRCGFRDTGRTREAIFLNGRYYDRLHMDILENEFTGSFIQNHRTLFLKQPDSNF